ncbi:MAG: helix-turn-helix domain-containing protein [Vulcanimicrobiota bacterium]|nr:helix-turn-helix transcriptional regulator [Candidatus Eremiobacteraeota bacterium]
MKLKANLLGNRITMARRSCLMSELELASEAGIAANLLRAFEAGQRWPRLDTLALIAEATGFPVIWFIEDWLENPSLFLLPGSTNDLFQAV